MAMVIFTSFGQGWQYSQRLQKAFPSLVR